ncbi:MAG TPA: HIT family protein, partial [Kofleriaceae bacterium]|nr:HIT family protein [Kofleriaceae bacterium]
LVMLPRYVRRWGHIVVMPRAHVTTYTGIDHAAWARINSDALHAAKMLERLCSPLRIYVTSTGSSAGELTQTSMHLHVHVIPLYDNHDRPADVFSWQGGVTVAEHDEWEALRSTYAREWAHGYSISSGSPVGSYASSAAAKVASAVGVGS